MPVILYHFDFLCRVAQPLATGTGTNRDGVRDKNTPPCRMLSHLQRISSLHEG